jgi:hypothetical protein
VLLIFVLGLVAFGAIYGKYQHEFENKLGVFGSIAFILLVFVAWTIFCYTVLVDVISIVN